VVRLMLNRDSDSIKLAAGALNVSRVFQKLVKFALCYQRLDRYGDIDCDCTMKVRPNFG
jgi:hypothetical protein